MRGQRHREVLRQRPWRGLRQPERRVGQIRPRRRHRVAQQQIARRQQRRRHHQRQRQRVGRHPEAGDQTGRSGGRSDGRCAGSFSVSASAAGIGPVSGSTPAEETAVGAVQAGVDQRGLGPQAERPQQRATDQRHQPHRGERDRQDAAPQRHPVPLVAGTGDLRFDGLLVGGDRVVDERHLGLEGIPRVVVVAVLLGLDDGARHRIHPEGALRGVVAGHRDRFVRVTGQTPQRRPRGDLAVLVVVVERRVLDRLDQLAVGVVADVLGEPVGGQAVDVFFAVVVGVERLLRDRVEERVGLLLGVEREPVRQPLVRQRDVGRRLVVLDGARLLHRATGVAFAGHGQRGPAVEGDGVDHRQQQAVVLLLVGAPQRAADLQGDHVGVRRRLDADLLLQRQRHVAVDDEPVARPATPGRARSRCRR